MCPLAIHKELVLMLSFWQVQDGYKVIVAGRERKQRVSAGWDALSAYLQNQP